jgi:CRP-like cAMP-binding protein
MTEKLLQCPLFRGMNAPDLDRILASLFYQVKTYGRNELLVSAGEDVASLIVILSGSVRGEMVDFSGKVIKIEDIEAVRPLAPAFLFGKEHYFPVNITANEEVSALLLPRNSVIRLMQLEKTFLENFLNHISDRARFLSDKLKFLSFQSIRGKVAHYLLQHAQKAGSDTFQLDKSHEELAAFFGVTRPSLSRVIRELDQENIIRATGKTIRILERGRLAGMISR